MNRDNQVLVAANMQVNKRMRTIAITVAQVLQTTSPQILEAGSPKKNVCEWKLPW